jgi:hypothetical protein
MAIITHVCPHCKTDHIGLRIVALTRNGNQPIVHLTCPKCDLPSSAKLSLINPTLGIDQWAQWPGDYLQMGYGVERFWPEPPKPQIPELIHPDIDRVYLQAERNFVIEGNEEAAGMMYRKALDIGLKKIDSSLKGMLGARIKTLAKDGRLTASIAEWSDDVKTLGNDAAHEEAAIGRDELAHLRDFTEMVLRYLFTLPNTVKKRRGETLEWETAQPRLMLPLRPVLLGVKLRAPSRLSLSASLRRRR